MDMKNILLFVGGLAVGGVTGVLTTKKYFENKYQKQYELDHIALEEYYHRTDEYTRKQDYNEEEFEDDGINSPNEMDSKPGGRMDQEQRTDIKEKLNRNWKETTNYANMYKEKNDYTEEVIEEKEVFEDEIVEDTPEEEAFEEHQKNKNKPPRIISEEDYINLPAHIEKEVLYLYAFDEVLTDDNEEPIEEYERLIGDALTKFNFIDSEEMIIFVMNYSMDVCYEIQKLQASWSDTH